MHKAWVPVICKGASDRQNVSSPIMSIRCKPHMTLKHASGSPYQFLWLRQCEGSRHGQLSYPDNSKVKGHNMGVHSAWLRVIWAVRGGGRVRGWPCPMNLILKLLHPVLTTYLHITLTPWVVSLNKTRGYYIHSMEALQSGWYSISKPIIMENCRTSLWGCAQWTGLWLLNAV